MSWRCQKRHFIAHELKIGNPQGNLNNPCSFPAFGSSITFVAATTATVLDSCPTIFSLLRSRSLRLTLFIRRTLQKTIEVRVPKNERLSLFFKMLGMSSNYIMPRRALTFRTLKQRNFCPLSRRIRPWVTQSLPDSRLANVYTLKAI